jgi:Fe-S cluster biogenesis protein NfuA
LDVMQQIEQVLDERVRPALASHRGNIRVESFRGGVLRVRLLGQCSNCPSALDTTEELVAAELKAALPQIRQVVLVAGVSDGLLEQARALLRNRS